MATVGIKELKAHTTDILQKVRDQGQPIDITLRGVVIARIVPVVFPPHEQAQTRAAWSDLKQLAADIGTSTRSPIDITTFMAEERS